MTSRRRSVSWFAFAALVFIALTACQKPTAQFQPGDKVKLKFTETEGVVVLRTRLFRENLYHVSVAGTNREHYPVGENEQRLALRAQRGESEYLQSPHDEGPYYESQLERVSR